MNTIATFEKIQYNSYKELLVIREGQLLKIQINRARVKNALNRNAYYELIRILRATQYDPKISIIVFTGVGDDAFCAGTDLRDSEATLNEFKAITDPELAEYKRLRLNKNANFVIQSLATALIDSPKLLIALVNGCSIGIGFTMAALCDIVYCTENAYFQAPFTALGICPEMCSSYLLERSLGRAKAREILLLGTKLTAQEALQFHFVAGIYHRSRDEIDKVFWPKMLEYSTKLPGSCLEIGKKLMCREEERTLLLQTLKAECIQMERLRLQDFHVKNIQQILNKNNQNKKSKL